MFEYVTNSTIDEMAEAIDGAKRVALAAHQKPDGDALGSMLALARVLHARGRTAEILVVGPIESCMKEIAGTTPLHHVEHVTPGDDHDLVILVDTGAWSQVDSLEPWLRRHRERVIGFDHHARGDDIAPRRIVDISAASTTRMLVPLFDAMGHELTGEAGGVAEALFVGLATDTGWFRFDNAGADAFAVAARSLATGVDKSRLYQVIEEGHRPARLALTARALGSLAYAADGTVALMSLGIADFREAHGSPEDLTNIVNAPMVVGTVRVSILLTQVVAGHTKLSFRSKPAAEPGGAIVDVNELAHHFGGGGHRHAAGARVQMEMDEALAAVYAVVEGKP